MKKEIINVGTQGKKIEKKKRKQIDSLAITWEGGWGDNGIGSLFVRRGRVGGETAVKSSVSKRSSARAPNWIRPIGFAASGCGSLISIDWYYQPVLT